MQITRHPEIIGFGLDSCFGFNSEQVLGRLYYCVDHNYDCATTIEFATNKCLPYGKMENKIISLGEGEKFTEIRR